MATEIPEIGEKVTHWRRPTPASCALVMAPVPTDRQLKIAEMLNLAKECGFACEALTTYHSALASNIASHLVHRLGKSVSRSVDFSITLFSSDDAVSSWGALPVLNRALQRYRHNLLGCLLIVTPVATTASRQLERR